MKSYFTFFFFLVFVSSLMAQVPCPDCPPNNADQTEYDVIKIDPKMSQYDYVPGQVLVRFKDETQIVLGKTNGIVSMGIPTVDAILQKYNVREAEKIFPLEKKKLEKKYFKTSNGLEIEVPSLHNIHKLQTDSTANIYEIIEALKQDENVVYAEPNYMLSIVESEPLSPELSETEMLEWLKQNPLSTQQINNSTNQPFSPEVVTPNDPLYSQQWGIPATQVDAVWDSTTGDTTQLIAILDTGVDWLHPDLKNKIWTNPGEIPDNGIDDDGNGKVDDVRGWDWINNDNNPTDDNSHGTHVAGIAGAESNNGIGIAGVNWGAKIMPLKVFQSSGRGDASTITQGIIYAKNKGATVINMSFGSYARSLTMEDALANAYATTILVAAAGNDGRCIGPGSCIGGPGLPFYPAALSFILGTEALAGFSNYDQDGPVFSRFADLLNYELRAPGEGIISCVPNGGYRLYNGTSMSAPLVSGAVSLYRTKHPLDSQELMWGNLVNTINGNIKVFDALNIQTKPVLWFVNQNIVDTIDGDNDGRVDAGETIELWFTVRNTWGQSDSVFVGIRFAEFEDTTTAQILKKDVFIGSISPYARRTNEFNPLKIRINSNVSHARDILFEGLIWYKGAEDTTIQRIVLNVENGFQLPGGIFDSVLVLTPEHMWLINQPLKFTGSGGLIVLPGTRVVLTQSLSGVKTAVGTKDSLISFEGNGLVRIEGANFSFCNLSSFESVNGYFDHCNLDGIVKQDYLNIPAVSGRMKYCRIQNSGAPYGLLGCDSILNTTILNSYSAYHPFQIFYDPAVFERNNVINWVNYHGTMNGNTPIVNRFNNFVGVAGSLYAPSPISQQGFFNQGSASVRQKQNNIINCTDLFVAPSGNNILQIDSMYWGTNNIQKVRKQVHDFWNDVTLSMYDFQPCLISPTDSAHGIVWKVLVNGKDAQDEIVEPVGPGRQRFDVYFNRPMDKTIAPEVGFGVRYPFSSNIVNEDGEWSADGRIYTVYKTVKIYSGDGINRVRVTGAKDLEGWEIPTEDMRFEFLIDAAGSASVDFQATAGLGKVSLEWSNPSPTDVPDLLGYNMYRLEHINDTTLTQPVMINTSLINDTLYTDFSITPNEKYYYYYRVVRTDFSESDSSKVVSCIPYTAARGDANGDLSINILDITSIVNYLLNQNPQPFILEAADVNQDAQVNILDVVGVVNLIMENPVNKTAEQTLKPKLTFDAKTAYIENSEGLAGLQFKLIGKGISKSGIIVGDAAKNLELSYNINGDTLNVILYSFKNSTLSGGEKGMLFRLTEGYFSELKSVLGSNTRGESVEISLVNDGEIIPKDYQLYQNYPNPFNPSTTIRYALPNQEDVEIRIYNILGQKVWEYTMAEQIPGYYEVKWNSRNSYGLPVSSGIYIYQIKAGKYISQKKMVLLK